MKARSSFPRLGDKVTIGTLDSKGHFTLGVGTVVKAKCFSPDNGWFRYTVALPDGTRVKAILDRAGFHMDV